MGNIYSSFSPLSHPSLTTESSALTGQPESEFPNAVTCSSLISGNSSTSTCTGYKTQVVQPLEPRVVALNKESVAPKNAKHVNNGMKANVPTQLSPAAMPMSARNVVSTPTPQNAKNNTSEPWATRPRYLRNYVWPDEQPSSIPSALATEYMLPVPSPPVNELSNFPVIRTIQQHPHLFKIITPINVDLFESYLLQHPNCSFVWSVCHGLREGFWPWAITDNPEYPLTWDNSHRLLREAAHVEFVREQRDLEIRFGQFSPSFGPDLLPGMYSMPIGVVPKPHSDKFWLVVDQSAKPFSLNSMIPKHEGSIQLDNLHDFGRILRNVHKKFGNAKLVTFKSDVSRAYRLLPVHLLW